MLRIKNLTISLGDNLLCLNQNIDLREGVCAIVGEDDALKNALAYIVTSSNSYGVAEMDFSGDFELDNVQMGYYELKKRLNPFIHFDQGDTVKSTIMFANYAMHKKIISDFKLTGMEDRRVVDLNVSMFRIWEMAMASASQAKIVYVTQTFTSRKKFKYYLKKLKKYLKEAHSYIFVGIHNFLEFNYENALVMRNSTISSVSLQRNGKYKSLIKFLENNQKINEVKAAMKKAPQVSKDFYKAYVTGEETSSATYSPFESTLDSGGSKKKLLFSSFILEALDLISKIGKSLKFILYTLLGGLCSALNIRIGAEGPFVLLSRSRIFICRKIYKKDETERFTDNYVSLGVLIYFYLLFRYFKSVVLSCIYVIAVTFDFLSIFLFFVMFDRIREFATENLVVLPLNCSLKKKYFVHGHSEKSFITMLSKGLKSGILKLFLKASGVLLNESKSFSIVKLNEICKELIFNILFSLCFRKTVSLYKWLSIIRDINFKCVAHSFYEAWSRPLTNIEFKAISIIIMFSVLSFNFNLIAEDINFIKASLYITIHPFTYYVYVIFYSFFSTLPIFIFSIFTNCSTLVPVYYNFILLSAVLNSFVNTSLKIIIISLLMISHFVFSQGIIPTIIDVLFPHVPDSMHIILNPLAIYFLFCVLISVFIK